MNHVAHSNPGRVLAEIIPKNQRRAGSVRISIYCGHSAHRRLRRVFTSEH